MSPPATTTGAPALALAPLLAAMRADRNFSASDSVVYSSGGQHLAMCICAKCGSTSLFSWLYEGIYGAPFGASHRGPPWVQQVPSWEPPPNGAISFSDVPSTGPVDHFTIVRDPLDRYYSAWKSKIRCDRSDAADGNRLVPDLLRRAGLPASAMSEVRASDRTAPVPVTYCLGFKEFALAMRRIHARGQQARLDMHLLPQSLGRCKRDARRMTIAQFASVAPELSDRFGLQHVVFPHTHAEMTEAEAAHAAEARKEVEAELCAIVYPEYDWMGDDTTFARRCPQGTYRPLEAEKRLEGRLLLEADRSEKMPTVEVLRCPSKKLLELVNADKVVREDALIDIFTTHFAPRGDEAPDLMFLPTACGWSDPARQPEGGARTPRLGYFAVASMPWGAFPSGRDAMQPLLTQSWPARMAVLSVEVPSYAPSWDGEAREAKLTPMWKWGGKHPPAAAMVIPYVSLLPPAAVLTLDERPALAAFVGTVHNLNTDKPDVGRGPLRARLLEECRGPTLDWRDCIFISDHDSGHDRRFNMSVQQHRISREGADGVYDSSHAMVDLASMASEAYSKARFTLCPWGDTLTRKSIFDAMMQGSIPVLFDGTILREYARLGPIEDMTVVVPLRAVTAQGSGALEYLRALPADRVAQLHDNVVKWRLNFHLPTSADLHVPGDAVDAIVRRVAAHFEGHLTLPPLPTRRGFKARQHKQLRADREAESSRPTEASDAVHSESSSGGAASTAESSSQPQSDLQLPPFSPHAACGGGCACARDPLPKPRDTVRFFLHDQGVFDFSDMRLPAEGSDSLPIDEAEHLTDFFVVNALRSHAQRTRVKSEATVHVLGALPFTSWVQQPPEEHARRMRRMAAALAKSPRYLAGVPFVLVMSHWNVQDILGPELLDVMRHGRAVLATSDSQSPALAGPLRWLSTVVMPYRAHHLAEAAAFAEGPERTKRPINVTFDGWTERKTRWPALRPTLVKVLQQLNTSVSDSAVANYGAPHDGAPAPEQALAASRSVSTMMAASVCAVPEGDTWTSRRLFEALAVGCVPLLVRGPRSAEEARVDELDLPFRASIDWSQVTLGVMELSPEHAPEADAERLRRFLLSSGAAEQLAALRARGRAAFRQHLAIERHPKGVANAMLRELSCSNRSLWGSDARHPLGMRQRSPMLHWDNRTADGLGPIRDVLDQRYVNWSLPGSFEALPYLADRLIILPREKLVSPVPRPPPHLSPAP